VISGVGGKFNGVGVRGFSGEFSAISSAGEHPERCHWLWVLMTRWKVTTLEVLRPNGRAEGRALPLPPDLPRAENVFIEQLGGAGWISWNDRG
jgi:hypothetical protein